MQHPKLKQFKNIHFIVDFLLVVEIYQDEN